MTLPGLSAAMTEGSCSPSTEIHQIDCSPTKASKTTPGGGSCLDFRSARSMALRYGTAKSPGFDPELRSVDRRCPRPGRVTPRPECVDRYASQMADTQLLNPVVGDRGSRATQRVVIAGLSALGVGLVAGYVGWKLVEPGASLVLTCIIVAAIPLAGLLVGWRWLRAPGDHTTRRLFVIATTTFGFAAVWWTYAFAMPASMAWDAAATSQAHHALIGVPVDKSQCIAITNGSIGPLRAPYNRCATNAPQPGSVVYYYVMSGPRTEADPYRGLVFNEGPASGLSDECVRHLTGDWYAFTADPQGLTGYDQCLGGP